MRLSLLLVAALSVPAPAAVSLRWAPALEAALPELSGRPAEIAAGLDGDALKGLNIRINEVHALAASGVRDLGGLRSFRRRVGSSEIMAPDRLEALERSLYVLSPVILRLEARGISVDDRGEASSPLARALSQAFEDEARAADKRAKELTARYATEQDLDSALADSKEVDALLRDRYPYLSVESLHRLARVHDMGRTERIAAARRETGAEIVSRAERASMRDAVADEPPSLFKRIKARVRALAR